MIVCLQNPRRNCRREHGRLALKCEFVSAGSRRTAAHLLQFGRQAGSVPPLCKSVQLQRVHGSEPPYMRKDKSVNTIQARKFAAGDIPY
jgi:hypothetical protein